MSPWLRRRCVLDRVAAGMLMVAVSPLLALLGLLVRCHDDGPAVIRLPRVGRGGSQFGMWKLRTMRMSPVGGPAGPALTGGDDDRVTRLGRRLRNSRLDELPQLLNVLRGEMALIGPRPEAPEYVDRGDPLWRTVLEANPGIAGATQLVVYDWEAEVISVVEGDRVYRDVVLPVKLTIDAWYVHHASPWIDVLVMASLAQRFLAGRRRTWIHKRVVRDLPALGPAHLTTLPTRPRPA